jgi:hypothetical protein
MTVVESGDPEIAKYWCSIIVHADKQADGPLTKLTENLSADAITREPGGSIVTGDV